MKRWLFVSVAAASVFACGGSTGSGSSSAGGSGGSGATAASGGNGGTQGGSGGVGSASGGSGGVTGGSGGVGALGGGAGVAGTGGAAGQSGAAGAAGAGGVAGPGVACGNATCVAGEGCLVCDPTGAQSPKQCVTGFTGNCPSFPVLRIFCDDQSDCAANNDCAMVEGSVGTYAECIQAMACSTDCSCGPGAFALVCNSLADCPVCSTACKPYQQSPQGGAFPIKVCSS